MAASPFTATDKAKIVRKARSLARLSESFLDIEPEMMKTSAGMTRVSFVAGKGDALVATARIHGKTHRFSMAPKRRTKPRKTANPSKSTARVRVKVTNEYGDVVKTWVIVIRDPAGEHNALVRARMKARQHRDVLPSDTIHAEIAMAPKRRTKPRKTANPSRLVAKPKAGALAYSVKVDGKTISGGRYRSLAAAREVFRELQRRYPGRVEMFRGTESYSSWGVSDARRMKATRKKHHSKTRRAKR